MLVQQAGGPALRSISSIAGLAKDSFIRRHDHIRDALHDMTGASVRDDTPYNISVTIEPLVCLLSIPDPLASASYPPHEENDLDAMDIATAVDATEDTHCIEDIPRLYCICPCDPCRSPRSRYRGQSMSGRPQYQRR